MLDNEIEPRPDAAAEQAPPLADDASIWLKTLEQAGKIFEPYQDKADAIDALHGELDKLGNVNRDRDFQLFWANIQVLAPSIYARAPVPVVTPKFADGKPVLQTASEVLERCTVMSFDQSAINEVMLELRDDLAILSRAVSWVRYEDRDGTERVCIEHVDRKDFLHEPARKWAEVGWVARRAWLTRDEMKDRFETASGAAFENAEYATRKERSENDSDDGQKKAGVWEIWSRTANRVIWVTPGVDTVLDSGQPHLKLEGFFPCPKPAYGTRRRRSLIPVPDMLYYKDQLEEIAGLTRRIHALSDAIKVKGFYPSAGEQGEAIETALKVNDDRKIMVPVSNWAAFGEGGEPVVWLPVEKIVSTVSALVILRRQIIDDVYQIVGLSDIMRGSTQANETATAQNIKAQYGSVRIRDRQQELVRVARDLARITGEIIAENFDRNTIEEMCQMDLPDDAEIHRHAEHIAATTEMDTAQLVRQLQSDPQMAQQAQHNPEQAKAMLAAMQQKAHNRIAALEAVITIDQVMKVLRDQRIRPFILDIETDSTIQPDEQAEKEARNEFMRVCTSSMATLGQLVSATPEAAPLAGALLKFTLAPYRAGREIGGMIDNFVANLEAKATQAQPDAKARAEAAQNAAASELQMKQAELQLREQEMIFKAQAEQQRQQAELLLKQQEAENRRVETTLHMRHLDHQNQREQQKHQQELEKTHLEIERLRLDIAARANHCGG